MARNRPEAALGRLVFIGAVSALLAVLAVLLASALARAEVATACTKAAGLEAELKSRAAVVLDLDGPGVTGLVVDAWALAGKGDPPIVTHALMAIFSDDLAGLYPVADGMVCSSIVLSRRMFERLGRPKGPFI